jgi:Family of unknown function (DUF6335)
MAKAKNAARRRTGVPQKQQNKNQVRPRAKQPSNQPANPQEIDANDVVREYYEASEVPTSEVLEVFVEGQRTGSSDQHCRNLGDNPRGPEISAQDLDAAWDRADEGEEAVGGSSPTPDQDIVEEIGEAAGVSYQDAEPLRMEEKLAKRDENRWELDPASAEDYTDRISEQKKINKRGRAAS